MTTLNLNSFLDGSSAPGTDVSENFYDPQSAVVATSFEMLNGWLDSGNTEPTWVMDTYHLQPHSLTEGLMVGATLNHDYFGEAFFAKFNGYTKVNDTWTWVGEEGNIADNNPAGEHGFFTPIPGGGITFFVPFSTAFVILTWNIRWTHDGEAILDEDDPDLTVALDEERAAIRLFVKTPTDAVSSPPGVGYADNYRRVIGQVNARPFPVAVGVDPLVVARFDYSRHREWSGHYILGAASAQPSAIEGVPVPSGNTGVSAGWYSANLRIATSAKQARVQVRSMRYICFKLEAPSES